MKLLLFVVLQAALPLTAQHCLAHSQVLRAMLPASVSSETAAAVAAVLSGIFVSSVYAISALYEPPPSDEPEPEHARLGTNVMQGNDAVASSEQKKNE